MRTFHVSTSLGVGGAELMLKRLLLSDAGAKNNTVVVSLLDLGKVGDSLVAAGFTVYALNMRGFFSFPVAVLRLVKLLRQHNPDVVQTWMYHADLLGGIAARIARCPGIVWGVRNTYVPIGSPVTYWIMKVCAFLSYLIPQKIVCVAEASRVAHEGYGYCVEKMLVIPNGFSFDRFDSRKVDRETLRRSLGVESDTIVIGCVGRFHADKGQDLFVKAAALLIGEHPGLKFMLVGRGCDASNRELARLTDDLGLSTSFLLLGERDDVPECLAAMDIFCMPSRTEGFPNGLGEAMAMGLPCVAARVGDTAVLTGETVSLVAPENPRALANAMSYLVQLPREKRYAIGALAAKRVRNEFSIEIARKRFYAVHTGLLELHI